MKKHALIERYLYAVTKQLPEKNREDIKREINTLIEDLIEGYDNMPEEDKVKQALLELGDPNELADHYREKKNYLIGPANFSHYVMTLKIVLIVIFIGTSITSIIEVAFLNGAFLDVIGGYFGNVLASLAQGFAWVTIIFAIIEHNHVNLKEEPKNWKLNDLPELPKQNLKISKGSSIVGIFFITVFTIIFYYIPETIAVYMQEDGEYLKIPLFAADVIQDYRFLILSLFVIGIIKEVIKIIVGYWTWFVTIAYSVLTVLSTLLIAVFILDESIWNPNLKEELEHLFKIEVTFTDYLPTIFISIIVIGTAIDLITIFVKQLKYKL